VDAAAAGFADVTCAGLAAPTGAAVAGLAGSGAVAEPAGPALWPNAGAVASIVAMATIVILRMSDSLGMRREGAEFEINWLGRRSRMNGIGPDPRFWFRKR
jgi:hypothetical protein